MNTSVRSQVDPNAERTDTGLTPLMLAAKGASVDALKVLIVNGANVNAVDNSGNTALGHTTALDKRSTLVCAAILLASGAKPLMPGKLAS